MESSISASAETILGKSSILASIKASISAVWSIIAPTEINAAGDAVSIYIFVYTW